MKRAIILFVLAAALALAAPAVRAATETADLTVTAEYYTPTEVYISWVESLDFSPWTDYYYHPGQAGALENSAQIEVYTWPSGRTFSIYCDNGENASGAQKRMAGTGDYLEYQLYRDMSRTQAVPSSALEWTPTSAGGWMYFDIFGRIPGGQTIADGSYSDFVTFTVEYTP